MAVIHQPSLDPSRVYYGTDTRAAELLIGAALAMVWPSRKLRPGVPPGARRVLDAVGITGLAVIGLLIWRTTEFSSFLYHGGFALLSIATALVVAALAHPACRLGNVLGWAPLRWIGVRSYGIYLWAFPIVVLTRPAGEHGPDLVRNTLQVIAIVAVAALSWRFVEEPIRRGALGRLWASLKANRRRRRMAIPRAAWVVLAGAVTSLAVASAGLAGVNSRPEADSDPAIDEVTVTVPGPPVGSGLARGAATPSGRPCHAVAHLGDSTSAGLVSHDYLPKRKERIGAQYARVGAARQRFGISGAMSIVETYKGNPNARDLARSFIRDGFGGCFVLALGTNDTADVFVGSNAGRLERIERMMSAIGDRPVLWVNVKSLREGGPYSEANMRLWDDALEKACAHYPNMRVFDWASALKDAWFIDDGLHYSSPGYAARSRMIANALAHAFGPSSASGRSGCVVD